MITEVYNGEIHPCLGKNCLQCETCIYDKPLDDVVKPKKKKSECVCNYCGYLIKQFRDKGDKIFNACCSKAKIEAPNYSRPRTIDFRLTDDMDIETPGWCPKFKEAKMASSESKSTGLTYSERRDRLKALPPHLDWNQIEVNKMYVVPSILGRKRKILFAKFKTTYTLVCNDVDENGNVTDIITNIFKTDIDSNFIVEYKKF